MAEVRFRNVTKVYDRTVTAVKDFSLVVADREFVVLVGPSGCGKSTTLRMVAGLEEITSGEISIGGRPVNDLPPRDRDVAMVFQNYALYPHMTAYDNIAYGLKLRKFPKRVIDEKVREAAEILDISDLLGRKPKALSGGQRQRVAIGRAIVRQPQVFLMDEPLSNLDAKLRGQMRSEIIKLRQKVNTTFLYVTHDQTEAMTLGDRIVIMRDGLVQQVGTPREVYHHPANLFVAGFIGTPQMNFFDATLTRTGDSYAVEAAGIRVPLSDGKRRRLLAGNVPGGAVTLGVRPEQLRLTEDENAIAAALDVTEMMGSALHLHAAVQGRDAVAVLPVSEEEYAAWKKRLARGTTLRLSFPGTAAHLFDRETGENLERPPAGLMAVPEDPFAERAGPRPQSPSI